MATLLHLSPVFLVMSMLMVLRRPPVQAAMAGAALVALLWLVDAWMATGTAASGAALAAARDTGVLFLSTAFVIVPGLGFVILIERMGVNQALSQWVRSLGLGPADQVVFIVLGLAPLLEAMTGFGVSLIATVPLLLSLFERRAALRMALAGMAIMPWGTLGLATVIGASLAHVDAAALAAVSSLTSAPVFLVLGALSLSPTPAVRTGVRWYVQLFRNAPILVLIYFTTYVFPFELKLVGWTFPFPDWVKVVLGLALPTSANVAEIFRGAIQSIPSAQWEAAQSLAFRRSEIFRLIVLPQCVRRMLPPWMNLYASITMSTSLASLVGVHDVVDTAQIASNTVARTDFTILVYFTLLALFFAYCYPIARATRALERRHERH